MGTASLRIPGAWLLGLFALSGAAGLVYQSIWAHYLGLVLGHAAYAQTLVLGLFMGGMALGAWLVARRGARLRRLVLAYAVAEALIGAAGLGFHPLFQAYLGLSQDVVLPALDAPWLARIWQWLSAGALIAPQTVLLGATFPLLSAGWMRAVAARRAPGEAADADGGDARVLGGLYFANGFGAAIGALAATFVLLPAAGMPGTVAVAGAINLVVAAGAWWIARRLGEGAAAPGVEDAAAASAAPAPSASPSPEEAEAAEAAASAARRRAAALPMLTATLLVATAISGAASFVYEIGWVRMLNQALGTTVHSFELMLAAFLFGLAFGGLWVRRRAQRIDDAVRLAGQVQVWMGIAALLSLLVFARSFDGVAWLMSALARDDAGYALFTLGSAGVALLVMFPAAFFAGMTLPLFTTALLRAGAGEGAIGRVYAANTLGAIVGVLLAVHVLVPLLGVRMAVVLAALADIAVGLALLRHAADGAWTWASRAALLRAAVALVVALRFGAPDPIAQASGVFRTGEARLRGVEVPWIRDGKTATIAVIESPRGASIATNGKADASLTRLDQPPSDDEVTMVMLGVAPLALHPAPERIAVIGWGSGLTTHTLLGSRVPQVVDSIEIEPAMHAGARVFGERVARAYADPRSRLHLDDARTFFSTGARRYDVIVSEPSNPWVSGVAALFTHEFYALLRGHLEDDGLLVQWLHAYELDDALLATMLAALQQEFPGAELYVTNGSDLLIVARADGRPVGPPHAGPWREPALQRELRRVGLGHPDEFALRRIGGPAVLRAFVHEQGAAPHSDYYPTVSLRGPAARFANARTDALQDLLVHGLPVLDLLDCRTPPGSGARVAHTASSVVSRQRVLGLRMARAMREGEVGDELQRASLAHAESLQALLATPPREADLALWSYGVAVLAQGTLGVLPEADLRGVFIDPAWAGDPAEWPPAAAAVMAALDAAARRDAPAMLRDAEVALALEPSLSPLLREQLLVVAMLGAIGSGDPAEADALEARFGTGLLHGARLRPLRSWLLAWAETEGAGCAAR